MTTRIRSDKVPACVHGLSPALTEQLGTTDGHGKRCTTLGVGVVRMSLRGLKYVNGDGASVSVAPAASPESPQPVQGRGHAALP